MPEIEEYHYEGSLRDNPKRKLQALITTLGTRKISGLVLTLVIAIMLPVTLVAVRMQQNFRQHAATMPVTSPISITSAPTSIPSGTITPTSILTPIPTSIPTSTPNPQRYTISGQLFVDTNKNGIKDASEIGYPYSTGVTLSTGQQVSTDSSGMYYFTNLVAGTYQVTLSVPRAYGSTTQNPVSLTINKNTTYNMGIVPLPTSTPSPTLIPTATPTPAGITSGWMQVTPTSAKIVITAGYYQGLKAFTVKNISTKPDFWARAEINLVGTTSVIIDGASLWITKQGAEVKVKAMSWTVPGTYNGTISIINGYSTPVQTIKVPIQVTVVK